MSPPRGSIPRRVISCFNNILGSGITVSSEWSQDKDGQIDFRIIDPAWGIDLLQDGDRLTEHCERFLPGGLYHSWISRGLI